MSRRYREALVAIREDVREARDALISDNSEGCDEILERIEQTAMTELARPARALTKSVVGRTP